MLQAGKMAKRWMKWLSGQQATSLELEQCFSKPGPKTSSRGRPED